jgi:hypothetical protein
LEWKEAEEIARGGEGEVLDEVEDRGRREDGNLFQMIGAAQRKERLVVLTLDVEGRRERVRQDEDLVERGGWIWRR